MITWFQAILLVIAMAVAFGISIIVIKWLMKLLKNRTFIGFGIYRIALGIVLIIILYVANGGDLSIGVTANAQIQGFVDVLRNGNHATFDGLIAYRKLAFII